MDKIAHKIEEKDRTKDTILLDSAPFDKMMLNDVVKKGLKESGFVYPTSIQANAIPLGKAGIDLLIQSKSGTGKTLIFSAVLLEAYKSDICQPQSLIVVPTREIAVQIEMILNTIGKFCPGFKAASVIGGLSITEDRKKFLSAKAIVGTPGRILHLINSAIFNTSKVDLVVFDEADKLIGDNFEKDIRKILECFNNKKQIIACSATFCNELDTKIAKFMRNPLLISTDRRATLLVGIKQFIYELPEEKISILEMNQKLDALKRIFSKISFKQCLVFCGSQSRAVSYCNYLEKEGWPCEVISGSMDQKSRLEIFKRFLAFKIRILISTDLMSRGIDSEYVNLVVNMELPDDGPTYLHRIGRAGRFGSHGIAVTFVNSGKNQEKFSNIVKAIGTGMDVIKYPKEDNNFDFWDFSSSTSKICESDAEKNDNPTKRNKNSALLELLIDKPESTDLGTTSWANLFEEYENINSEKTDSINDNKSANIHIKCTDSNCESSPEVAKTVYKTSIENSSTVNEEKQITKLKNKELLSLLIEKPAKEIQSMPEPNVFDDYENFVSSNQSTDENQQETTQQANIFDDYDNFMSANPSTNESPNEGASSSEETEIKSTNCNLKSTIKAFAIDNPETNPKVDSNIFDDYVKYINREKISLVGSKMSFLKVINNTSDCGISPDLSKCSMSVNLSDSSSSTSETHDAAKTYTISNTIYPKSSTTDDVEEQNGDVQKTQQSLNISETDNTLGISELSGVLPREFSPESSGFDENCNHGDSSTITVSTEHSEASAETGNRSSSPSSFGHVDDSDAAAANIFDHGIDGAVAYESNEHETSLNHDYQNAYTRWTNIYWNQMTMIKDYVNFCEYARNQHF